MLKHTLQQAFTLRETNELVAIVGGGGKTSLMFALANSLPGRIVVTTTTRIFAAQMKLAAATVFFYRGERGERRVFNACVRKLG